MLFGVSVGNSLAGKKIEFIFAIYISAAIFIFLRYTIGYKMKLLFFMINWNKNNIRLTLFSLLGWSLE